MEYGWTEKKKTGIAAAVIVLLLILIGLFSLQIKTVTVTGNVRYTQEQITEMLFPDKVSRNPVVCYLKDHFQEHVEIPFVQDYKIEFQGLNKVEIIVYEKSVVGYVSYMSSCMYFDKDGIVVESTSKTLPGIPEITGLKFGHIVLYQKLPVENDAVFQEILNLTPNPFDLSAGGKPDSVQQLWRGSPLYGRFGSNSWEQCWNERKDCRA